MKIAENIRALRKERGMTQEQLAEYLGVSVAAVSKWETKLSVPDVNLMIGMADLFQVSVDALLGYEQQGSSLPELIEELRRCRNQKDFDHGLELADRLLKKYPNHFLAVYRSAEIYEVACLERSDAALAEKAVELLQRAVALIHQNTDPEISEIFIYVSIADCYTVQGKCEEAVRILKAHNPGGIHAGELGNLYAGMRRPKEALPYLGDAMVQHINRLLRVVTAYSNTYVYQRQYEMALRISAWLIGALQSMKLEEDTASYLDRFSALQAAHCAVYALRCGRGEEAARWLEDAARYARRFDAAPEYHLSGLLFSEGFRPTITVHDSFAVTAIESVETCLAEQEHPALLERWRLLCGRNAAPC